MTVKTYKIRMTTIEVWQWTTPGELVDAPSWVNEMNERGDLLVGDRLIRMSTPAGYRYVDMNGYMARTPQGNIVAVTQDQLDNDWEPV